VLNESQSQGSERGGWGNKLGKNRWRLALYRERRDGMLRAVLHVNGALVMGLDYHRNISRSGSKLIPPGYHWDVYPPFVALKDKFTAELPSLARAVGTGDQAQVDRAVLAVVCKFWHLRFAPEERTLLSRRRGR
jgi:hypothetical protein